MGCSGGREENVAGWWWLPGGLVHQKKNSRRTGVGWQVARRVAPRSRRDVPHRHTVTASSPRRRRRRRGGSRCTALAIPSLSISCKYESRSVHSRGINSSPRRSRVLGFMRCCLGRRRRADWTPPASLPSWQGSGRCPVIMARKQAVSGQIAVTTMMVIAAKG